MSEQKKSKFLPCPFCAETQIKLDKWQKSIDVWEVFCLKCKANTQAKFTKTEAIIAWNSRVNNHQALIDALKNILTSGAPISAELFRAGKEALLAAGELP